MSEAVTAMAVVVPANDATKGKSVSSKKKVTAAGKGPAKKHTVEHPKYSEMVNQALGSLKERGGSSRQAVLKYIMKNFKVGNDESVVNTHLKIALRSGVKNATLKQSKGSGATGSFRLGEEAKKKAAVKPAAKTTKKAKTPPAAKIRKTTKKTAADKSTKSPAKKMIKKATTKSVSKSAGSSAAAKTVNKPKVATAAKKSKTDKPKKAVKKVKADKAPKSSSTAGAAKVVKKPVSKKTPAAKKSTKPSAAKKA